MHNNLLTTSEASFLTGKSEDEICDAVIRGDLDAWMQDGVMRTSYLDVNQVKVWARRQEKKATEEQGAQE